MQIEDVDDVLELVRDDEHLEVDVLDEVDVSAILENDDDEVELLEFELTELQVDDENDELDFVDIDDDEEVDGDQTLELIDVIDDETDEGMLFDDVSDVMLLIVDDEVDEVLLTDDDDVELNE